MTSSSPGSRVVNQIRLGTEVYSQYSRYREIILVFIKFGFGRFVQFGNIQTFLRIRKHANKIDPELVKKSNAIRFRLALEELGPTFVKFGQILSSRRDIIDEELHNELRKLQDQVPPFPASEARTIIQEELQQPIQNIFKTFQDVPVASASIAQVHRATLPNGKVVAIKVQRPHIQETIQADLKILATLARLIEKYVEELSVFDPEGVVHEFSKTLLDELDFTIEAENMDRFARQFKADHHIKVPHPYPSLSTSRVLTMEFISGYRVTEPETLRKHDIDPVKLSHDISRLIYKQMFQFGFFHGDPHPGNMTVLPIGITALYDYGIMGNLSPQFRTDIANMVLGLTRKDHKLVILSLLGMSEKGFVKDARKLESDTGIFVEHYLNKPLRELKFGFVFNRLLDLLREHELKMKPNFYLGIKALMQVEDIAQDLNPNLNFIKLGRPYAQKAIGKKYDFEHFKDYLQKVWTASLDVMEQLPSDFKDFYERFKAGNHSIPIEHRINPEGFEPLRNTMNHIANRLTHAILAASVLLSSSIMILSGIRPKWYDIPILGLLGVFFGVLMTFRLFLSIWKRGGF